MPLTYTADRRDFQAAVELYAGCQHHPLVTLVCWAMSADGHIWVQQAHGWRDEFVGPAVNEETVGFAAQFGLSAPVAEPRPGQARHYREVLEHRAADCSYTVTLGDNGRARIRDLLRRMHAAKREHWSIEVNDFLRDPESVYRSVAAH